MVGDETLKMSPWCDSQLNPVGVGRADGKVSLQREGDHHEDGGAHGHVRRHVHVRQHRFRVWKQMQCQM